MARRIVIVSEDLVEPWDEGIKKFTVSIGRALAADHTVRIINIDRSGLAAAQGGTSGAADSIRNLASTKSFVCPLLFRELARARPEAVIYVPSPSSTMASIFRSSVLRVHQPRARVGLVALIPRRHGDAAKALFRGMRPHRIFVPSYASLLHLHELGLAGDILPIGVDAATFRPSRDGEKVRLRREHGVPDDAFVYLHVGHLSARRNLRVLTRLAKEPGATVIVIGSTSTPEDSELRAELETAGVRVIRKFVPVHEFYRIADAYVFPTVDSEGCVEIPLSVFEALASGVPVLARPFGGLRDFIAPGDDVRYFDTEDELVAHAAALQRQRTTAVRDMSEFAWRRVADRLLDGLLERTGGRS
jgi:glycosyltransferase involved in cell wall biosynthesis